MPIQIISPGAEASPACIVSANEERPGPNGDFLATMAQPPYRLQRLEDLLAKRIATEQPVDAAFCLALQNDLHSLQGKRLTPRFVAALDEGPVRHHLSQWDFQSGTDSYGAHAFAIAHRAALSSLADELGGEAWLQALENTEVRIWWSRALDDLLDSDSSWGPGRRGDLLRAALQECSKAAVRPWGEVQTLRPAQPIAGLPILRSFAERLGMAAPRRGLPGSLATVRQAYEVGPKTARAAVAPAYRMVCDLSNQDVLSSLPGDYVGPAGRASLEDWFAGNLTTWPAGDSDSATRFTSISTADEV
jgi:hypothetical protein